MSDVHWMIQKPPLILPEEQSPAWPYKGFWAILEEADVVTAIKDQVDKLGPDFDQSFLRPFYRLVWLLNNQGHKTLQAYVRYSKQPACGPFGFYSEVHLGAFNPVSSIIVGNLDVILNLATALANAIERVLCRDDCKHRRVTLTPIRTKFGKQPNLQWGFCLSIRIEGCGASQAAGLAEWFTTVLEVLKAFERPSM